MIKHPSWTIERAREWEAQQPWLVGCNFIPSYAVNQLEMWQAGTFDPDIIARELGLAAGLGMNTVRVYLHDLDYAADPDGFKHRVDLFLALAGGKGIRPAFVFFDDCWNPDPQLGTQPEPRAGVHNSGWVQSPGERAVLDPAQWPRLERYVMDVIGTFGSDERVLMWDLYNEPGNRNLGERSLPLLQAAFDWARANRPDQPITAGVWCQNDALNTLQLAASDVITFHNYDAPDRLEAHIAELKQHGRPVMCTEYMARTRGSTFEACLPIFKREHVGCYNWGLVAGKTNTIYPWDTPMPGSAPPTWFHDIFRSDGTPFSEEEVAMIRALTGANSAAIGK
jgi:hypothetical protein